MDISSLLANRPNLTDYLGQENGQRTSWFDQSSTQTGNPLSLANQQTQGRTANNASYVLDISPEAQRALDSQNAASEGTGDHIKEAQQHFVHFFMEQNINLNELSPQASELLGGILEVLEESGTTARDTQTNALEMTASNGKRNVYTLTGENRRIRIAIEQGADGQNALTITDIYGNTADIAKITINQGEPPSFTVKQSQETFAYGRLAERQDQGTLEIDAY